MIVIIGDYHQILKDYTVQTKELSIQFEHTYFVYDVRDSNNVLLYMGMIHKNKIGSFRSKLDPSFVFSADPTEIKDKQIAMTQNHLLDRLWLEKPMGDFL